MNKLLKQLQPKFNLLKNIFLIGIAGAGTILILSSLSSCGDKTKYETELAQWKASRDSALQANIATNKIVDSLTKENSGIEKTLALNSIEITRLKKVAQANHVPTARIDSIILTAPDTCKPVTELLKKVTIERDTLLAVIVGQERSDSLQKSEIKNLKLSVGALRISNDSLIRVIAKVPEYKEPKLLKIIPLPSRKASFVAGFVAGLGSAVTASVIYNNITR